MYVSDTPKAAECMNILWVNMCMYLLGGRCPNPIHSRFPMPKHNNNQAHGYVFGCTQTTHIDCAVTITNICQYDTHN